MLACPEFAANQAFLRSRSVQSSCHAMGEASSATQPLLEDLESQQVWGDSPSLEVRLAGLEK